MLAGRQSISGSRRLFSCVCQASPAPPIAMSANEDDIRDTARVLIGYLLSSEGLQIATSFLRGDTPVLPPTRVSARKVTATANRTDAAEPVRSVTAVVTSRDPFRADVEWSLDGDEGIETGLTAVAAKFAFVARLGDLLTASAKLPGVEHATLVDDALALARSRAANPFEP